jgi:hypothetical protein
LRQRPRAVVVVTGSELVRGERTDLNGPFLAREVERLGLEAARIEIVGDAPEELERVLRSALDDADVVVTSSSSRRRSEPGCASTPSSSPRSRASRAPPRSGSGATTPTSRRA